MQYYGVIDMLRKLSTFLKAVIIVVLFIHLGIYNSYAQQESKEEIIAAIKNSDPETSATHELALLNLDISKKNIADCYADIGVSFYKEANYSRSQYYLEKSIHFGNMTNYNKRLSFSYLKLGNVFLYEWKNQEAIDAYYRSIDYSKKIGNLKSEALALTNAAIILRRMAEYKKALKMCNSATKLIRDGKNLVNLLTIKSEIYIDSKQLDSALLATNKGIKLSEGLNYYKGLVDLYVKNGIVFCHKKDFKNAEKFLIKAENMLNDQEIKSDKLLINLKYAKAHCYYDKGNYNEAITHLNEIIELFGTAIDPRKGRVLHTHLLLSKSYKKIGNVKESEAWYDKYIQLDDKFQLNQAKTINKIYKEDNAYLDSKINALKNDNIKSQKNNTYLQIAISIGVLILVAFAIHYRRKQKKNKALFNKLLKKVTTLETTESKNTPVVKEVVIDDSKVAAILKGLDKLEQQEYYLNDACNLRAVAKKIKTNATYLSKIINTHKNKNFNDYINDLRIDYAVKRLKNNKQFRSFSVKSIANEVGYKSDYSFAKHFKAKTGVNPSYYIKEIDKLETETNG